MYVLVATVRCGHDIGRQTPSGGDVALLDTHIEATENGRATDGTSWVHFQTGQEHEGYVFRAEGVHKRVTGCYG